MWEEKLPPSKAHIKERLAELDVDALLCLLTDEVDGA
jgi:glyoxylate reductase